jgi:hypothetical protein
MADRAYSSQEIQDRFAIEDLYDRQLAAAEAHDWPAYDTTFSADARIDLSDFGQPERDYSEYRAWLVELSRNMRQAQRITGGLRLRLEGARATTRVPVSCHVKLRAEEGEVWVHNGLFYEDELARTDDGWRIVRRRETLAWAAE